jgi:ankyrin repeat protein
MTLTCQLANVELLCRKRERVVTRKLIIITTLLLSTLLLGCRDGLGPEDPLVAAASQGDISTVRSMLEKGYYVDKRNPIGRTALMNAASGGYSEVVRLLLDKGAKVNAKSDYDSTAIESAARGGHVEVTNILLNRALVLARQGNLTATVRLLERADAKNQAERR